MVIQYLKSINCPGRAQNIPGPIIWYSLQHKEAVSFCIVPKRVHPCARIQNPCHTFILVLCIFFDFCAFIWRIGSIFQTLLTSKIYTSEMKTVCTNVEAILGRTPAKEAEHTKQHDLD